MTIRAPSIVLGLLASAAIASVAHAGAQPVVVVGTASVNCVSGCSGGGGGGAITAASGAYASGSIAAGAVASGAVSSGAYASGSLASGAVVDLTNVQTTAGGTAPGKALSVQGITGGTPLLTSVAGATHVQTAALATSLVVCSSACTATDFEVNVDSTISTNWWIEVFDATSAPASGAVTPVRAYQVNAGTYQGGANFWDGGVAFTTGEVIAISSAGPFTYTPIGAHAFIGAAHK